MKLHREHFMNVWHLSFLFLTHTANHLKMMMQSQGLFVCGVPPSACEGGSPSECVYLGPPPSPSGCVCVSHQFVWAVLPATITCSHQICLENLTALHPTAHCHRARGWGVRACSSWLCNRHHYLSDLREVSRSLFSPPDPHRWDSAPLGDLLQYFSEFGNTPRDLLL